MKFYPKGFGTLAIHAGNFEKETFGALATPIYQSSTFYFDSCEQGGKRFAAKRADIFTPDSEIPQPPFWKKKSLRSRAQKHVVR